MSRAVELQARQLVQQQSSLAQQQRTPAALAICVPSSSKAIQALLQLTAS